MGTIINKPALIEIRDGKIAMVRTKGQDVFFMPGGSLEPGENDHQGLIRECREEISIEIDEGSIEYYDTFEAQAHGKPEGTIVRMNCYTAKYEGEFKPGRKSDTEESEIEEIALLDYEDWERVGLTAKYIFDDLREKGLITGSIESKEHFMEAARKRRGERQRERELGGKRL